MKPKVILIVLIFSTGYLKAQTIDELKAETIDELKAENQVLKDSIANTTKLVDAISTLNNRLNRDFDGDKKERVQLGLSFAYGELTKDDLPRYKLPSINPVDSLLAYQQLDGRFILVSTTMTVTPFLYSDWISTTRSNIKAETKNRKLKKVGLWILENSGVSVNINFLEIATGSSQQSFNQIVEGGIGYSIRLNKNIYWSLSRELKFLNSLNDNFVEGKPIYVNGNKIGSIDEIDTGDQDYYHNKTLLHWSTRLIVNF
ncbi:MAG: hypothetical protein KA270_07015 [Saprospiraceae bacterium]|nr:hypothetical protein [Saprospiraceae bacterium]MBP6566899.1 hypothetical protein [Saprospiraceae bacterium]